MFEGVGIEYREVSGPYSGRAGTTSVRRNKESEFKLDAETRALFEEEITVELAHQFVGDGLIRNRVGPF